MAIPHRSSVRAAFSVALFVALVRVSSALARDTPLGLPPVPVPSDNPSSAPTAALGERLFFETGLSSDGAVSCGTCHRPERYFADGATVSKGVLGKTGDRNAPSILNAAYASHLLWDGRSLSLEDQVRYPVTHPREMDSSQKRVIAFLSADPAYVSMFNRAFGDEAVTWERVARAIASFERTLLTGNAPFDRYVAGRGNAIPKSARRGFELFRGKAGCINCHHYSRERPLFSDFEFHNTGVGWAASADLGRYEISKARADKGAFRTPSLRNVAKTAPYMHDGRMHSLREVIDYYSQGPAQNPFLDRQLHALNLAEAEKADLIAFLESLTGVVTYAPLLGERAGRAERGARPPVEVVAGADGSANHGKAIEAVFTGIGGLVADRAGHLYVADSGGERVYRIDTRTGTITEIAGTGRLSGGDPAADATQQTLAAPGPLALDREGRYLFVGEIVSRRIKRIDLATGAMLDLGTPEGGFGKPGGLALGRDGLLVADSPRGQVWRLEPGGQWTGLLAAGQRLRGGIRSLVADSEGDIYVVEYFAHRVLRLDAAGRFLPVAGTGEAGITADGAQAAQSALRTPDGLAFDGAGNLLVADKGNHRICRIDRQTGRLTTLLKAGEQGTEQRWTPGPITVDVEGTLWIGDIHRNRVLRYGPGAGAPTIVAGNGSIRDGGPAIEARLAHPGGVAVDAHGNIYVSDTLHHRVRVVDPRTQAIRTLAGTGTPGYNGDGIPAAEAWLGYPGRVQVDAAGRIYIADYYNNRVRRVDPGTRLITTVAGTGEAGEDGDDGPADKATLINPHAMLLHPDGDLIVASAVSSRLRAVDLGRGRIHGLPMPADLPETLEFYGLAAWKGGLVLASPRPGSIAFLKDGRLSQLWTSPVIAFPQDVAVSPEGQLYICETGRNRILKWDGSNLEVVVDNLGRPRSICFDGDGNLLVADTFHNRVLRVRIRGAHRPPATPPPL